MPDGAVSAFAADDRFFDRLPKNIHAGLTAEQRAAIAAALGERQGTPPPINIRFSLPMPPGRIYLAVMAGRDRRGHRRRNADRTVNPLRTMGNFIFVIVASVVFYAVAAGVLLTSSSIVPS
jgi:hypothetical protein